MTVNSISRQYYQNFDLAIFNSKLDFLIGKLSKLKSENTRKVYYTELYATYLQLIEIFCINSFAISDNDLLKNIFLFNRAIEEKIKSRFYKERNLQGDDFVLYLLKNFVFASKDDEKDRTQQKSDYRHLVMESIDDYVKDKDFLNSYKHGFRVFSGEKNSLSVSMSGSSDRAKIQSYSASVWYYKREEDIILKCSISFNWERVCVKTAVLISILENIKRVYLSDGKAVCFEFVNFVDRQKLMNTQGCFRMSSPVDN